jgi:hypothetical protein
MLVAMSTPTHRDRVLRTLRVIGQPLDDDQLSMQASISPRQAVNQVCRRLEREGLLRRYVGNDGKIVNELVAPDTDSSRTTTSIEQDPPTAEVVAEHDLPPGSSHEQRAAERLMLDVLGEALGLRLEPTTIRVASGARVEVDGASPDLDVLVECWAHQGPPKSAQRHKVLADAFKLTRVGQTRYPRPQLMLCLSDAEAAAPFLPSSRSWAARALQDLSIEVRVVELPADVRQALRDAQRRQYR